MSELMIIIDKLREATSSAKKDCDSQINKTVDYMTKDLKDKIIKHRDKQIKSQEEILTKSELELQETKKNLTENVEELKTLKSKLSDLFQHHITDKRDFEERIILISTKYKKNKMKQSKLNQIEFEQLEKKLNKKLVEKMKESRALMLKPDEILVKIDKMLSESNNIENDSIVLKK